MKRFIEEVSRAQVSLLPECLDDFVAEDNPIRVVEAFVSNSIWCPWSSMGPLLP